MVRGHRLPLGSPVRDGRIIVFIAATIDMHLCLMKIQNSMSFCPLHSRARELPFDSCAPHIVVSRSVLAARIETAMPQCSHAAGSRNRLVIVEIPSAQVPEARQ